MAALRDILDIYPNIRIEVTAKDLNEFAEMLVSRIKEFNDAQNDGFYTISEVMELYGIKDRSTLYKWDKRGYLPCEKVGSRVRYQKGLVHKILGNPKSLKIK